LSIERCAPNEWPTRHDAANTEDPFLYHVTSAEIADRILADGFDTGRPLIAYTAGPLARHAAGHTFFTAADGVGFWLERLDAHLFDQNDYDEDEAPGLAVLRVPRAALAADLLPDRIGRADARAEAFKVPTARLRGRPVATPTTRAHTHGTSPGLGTALTTTAAVAATARTHAPEQATVASPRPSAPRPTL
jgi:hypothetical protein